MFASGRSDLRAVALLSAALAAVTIVLFAPVLGFEFIGYDDPLYVTQNRHVQQGLTAASIKWAFEFGPGHALNYHPLTWLSHMLDVQLFGLRPGLHHFSSVILHAAAAVALLWFLWKATSALWPSAAVAALFAWHPMHVESVAWVAERKDVLSGLMFFLMLIAYARYARRPSIPAYIAVVVLFALGLLAKPMLVTAPFVLLLIDRWPLKRQVRWSLLLEKLPLLALAGVSSWLTYAIQQSEGAVATEESLPLWLRLRNVPVAYVRYLLKLIWPSNLSVFYPYEWWVHAHVIAAALVLIVITALLFVAWRRGREYPLIGWLWFLGMLVPVIGIVQVGAQSIADRYSYLPSVGLFIIACFAAVKFRRDAAILTAAGGMIVIMIVTSVQLRHWRDELTLFQHAARVTRHNYLAEGYIGKAMAARGDVVKAIQHYDRALEYKSNHFEAISNLANLQLRLQQYNSAIDHYRDAIKLRPKDPRPRNNLAVALASTGDLAAAEQALREAIGIDPQYDEAHATLGRVLLKQDKRAEAAAEFRIALRLNPDLEVAKRGLAEATTPP